MKKLLLVNAIILAISPMAHAELNNGLYLGAGYNKNSFSNSNVNSNNVKLSMGYSHKVTDNLSTIIEGSYAKLGHYNSNINHEHLYGKEYYTGEVTNTIKNFAWTTKLAYSPFENSGFYVAPMFSLNELKVKNVIHTPREKDNPRKKKKEKFIFNKTHSSSDFALGYGLEAGYEFNNNFGVNVQYNVINSSLNDVKKINSVSLNVSYKFGAVL